MVRGWYGISQSLFLVVVLINISACENVSNKQISSHDRFKLEVLQTTKWSDCTDKIKKTKKKIAPPLLGSFGLSIESVSNCYERFGWVGERTGKSTRNFILFIKRLDFAITVSDLRARDIQAALYNADTRFEMMRLKVIDEDLLVYRNGKPSKVQTFRIVVFGQTKGIFVRLPVILKTVPYWIVFGTDGGGGDIALARMMLIQSITTIQNQEGGQSAFLQ